MRWLYVLSGLAPSIMIARGAIRWALRGVLRINSSAPRYV
ncbi:hypothetical protein, partial [Pseudoalteromonas ruthenica]